MVTVGEVIDRLAKYPRDAAFSVSVDVSTSERDASQRAFGDTMIDCFDDGGHNVTLCLIGELNGDIEEEYPAPESVPEIQCSACGDFIPLGER